MQFLITLTTVPKKGLSSPEVEAVQQALATLMQPTPRVCTLGRLIQLAIEAESPEDSIAVARHIAESLLVNPLLETYSILCEPHV